MSAHQSQLSVDFLERPAACHERDGKGDGPAASELKTPPTDLTALTRQNGGKFPSDHVASVLRFGHALSWLEIDTYLAASARVA